MKLAFGTSVEQLIYLHDIGVRGITRELVSRTIEAENKTRNFWLLGLITLRGRFLCRRSRALVCSSSSRGTGTAVRGWLFGCHGSKYELRIGFDLKMSKYSSPLKETRISKFGKGYGGGGRSAKDPAGMLIKEFTLGFPNWKGPPDRESLWNVGKQVNPRKDKSPNRGVHYQLAIPSYPLLTDVPELKNAKKQRKKAFSGQKAIFQLPMYLEYSTMQLLAYPKSCRESATTSQKVKRRLALCGCPGMVPSLPANWSISGFSFLFFSPPPSVPH